MQYLSVRPEDIEALSRNQFHHFAQLFILHTVMLFSFNASREIVVSRARSNIGVGSRKLVFDALLHLLLSQSLSSPLDLHLNIRLNLLAWHSGRMAALNARHDPLNKTMASYLDAP